MPEPCRYGHQMEGRNVLFEGLLRRCRACANRRVRKHLRVMRGTRPENYKVQDESPRSESQHPPAAGLRCRQDRPSP